LTQVKIYRNTVHNKPQASQTQFITMGDYKLSICEVTGIQEELVGFKWDNNQFSLKRQNDIDLYNKLMWKVLI